MREDTIAAIATPFGQGAVSVIRVTGPEAVAAVSAIWRGRQALEEAEPRRALLGRVIDRASHQVDEALVTVYRAPASYTGEDLVEISGHGGILVAKTVLGLLLAGGARAAEPGEFTQRAFLNGKIDLSQAEAVMDVIEARTDLALRAANEQLEGRIGVLASGMREQLIGLTAHLEACIDFPEEGIDPKTGDALGAGLEAVIRSMDELLATAEQGRILREGVRTVICGKPNAGKSSLLNVLLGFDRAIVSREAGTTRDTIEEVINLRGIPLRLIDTAGLHEAKNAIDREGVDRATAQIEKGDVVIEVVDASLPRREASESIAGRHLLVLNKADLAVHPSWDEEAGVAVRISCLERSGVEELGDALVGLVTSGGCDWSGNPVAINARHQDCFKRARRDASAALEKIRAGEAPEFIALELRSCLEAVGEVIGKVDVEDILDEVFASFCIGK